ncbi:MAG TPA: response regulator [Pyrinomonadaceae bacterium]|nr:response regulator [Pyrinomonadaceae bacterium]
MLTGRKLLLADDSLTIQKVVSLTFGDEAMEVTTVGGGAEALEKLGESLPDIVLADVFMPEPNGYALCERIKTDERTRHIPVLLLVGTFEPFNEAEARRVGADEVLTKPFQSIRDLVNKVGGLLGGQPDEKSPDVERARHDTDEATQDLSPFADAARAADPAAETPAATTSISDDAFSDFDMDDATIQTTPAAAFDAHHAAPDFSEINEEEQFSDRGEMEEAFVLSDDDAPAAGVYAATAASGSPAGSALAAPVAESAFDAYASRAEEADDALLELGDSAPARAATDEADDFILDIGDEDSFDPPVFAPAYDPAAEADLLFAEQAQTTAAPEAFAMPELSAEPDLFSESLSSAEAEMPSSSSAVPVAETAPAHFAEEPGTLDAPEISVSPSLLFANEPARGAHDAESFPEQDETRLAPNAPAWDGEPVAASIVAHAGGIAHVESPGESRTAEPFGTDANEAVAAVAVASGSPAAASESGQAAAATPASSLSPEMLDEVVRRVVAHLSEQVVREIAWEVVPDLAERLIKQRLEEEQTRPR